jgi:exopolyphosphatase/pppGpp-phosphohydrolase
MSERLAVLDLGSNAVRLILAHVTPDVEFHVLRQERHASYVALGFRRVIGGDS